MCDDVPGTMDENIWRNGTFSENVFTFLGAMLGALTLCYSFKHHPGTSLHATKAGQRPLEMMLHCHSNLTTRQVISRSSNQGGGSLLFAMV